MPAGTDKSGIASPPAVAAPVAHASPVEEEIEPVVFFARHLEIKRQAVVDQCLYIKPQGRLLHVANGCRTGTIMPVMGCDAVYLPRGEQAPLPWEVLEVACLKPLPCVVGYQPSLTAMLPVVLMCGHNNVQVFGPFCYLKGEEPGLGVSCWQLLAGEPAGYGIGRV